MTRRDFMCLNLWIDMDKLEIREEFKKNFPEIADKIENDSAYNFLCDREFLGDNIIFTVLGGSYAYGTNKTDGSSDIDVRGVSLNTKREVLLGRDHEETVNEATDTTIYSTRKILQLLSKTNPNTIEMCGSVDRNALYISPIFKEFILDNTDLFLTKNAFFSFAGYANAQLNRLQNKLGRTVGKIEQQNILRSIENASKHLEERYGVSVKTIFPVTEENGLYILGEEESCDFDLIFKKVTKENAQSFLNEISSIFKDYNKLGKRNKSAIERGKLSKHFMHLYRLVLMGYDILINGEIITYREKEHDLLMSIRNNENNEWITDDNHLTEKAEIFISEQMKVLEKAKDESKLPEKPDMERLENLQMAINQYILENR